MLLQQAKGACQSHLNCWLKLHKKVSALLFTNDQRHDEMTASACAWCQLREMTPHLENARIFRFCLRLHSYMLFFRLVCLLLLPSSVCLCWTVEQIRRFSPKSDGLLGRLC